jgi:hypothetical protein
MRVPVGFPKCRKCGNSSTYSFHESCPNGGSLPLKIDRDSKTVYCESCGHSWYVFESNYHCTNCNTTVSANEIIGEVNILIEMAQMLARQWDHDEKIQKLIDSETERHVDKWISNAIQALGTFSGYLIGKVVAVFKSIFL